MTRQISFKVDDLQLIVRRTKDYFLKTGFHVTDEGLNHIHFRKGSFMRNMVTFNPLNWKSTVTVTVTDGVLSAEFDINTTGQLVTPKEEELWDKFINNFRKSMTDNVDLHLENEREIRTTKKQSLKYVMWALMGAILFGIPSGLIAYFTGVGSIAPVGSAFGAVALLTYKINQDRRKNGTHDK